MCPISAKVQLLRHISLVKLGFAEDGPKDFGFAHGKIEIIGSKLEEYPCIFGGFSHIGWPQHPNAEFACDLLRLPLLHPCPDCMDAHLGSAVLVSSENMCMQQSYIYVYIYICIFNKNKHIEPQL